MLRAIWLAENGHHDDLSNHLRMTIRDRSNSKRDWHHSGKQVGTHHHHNHRFAVVSAEFYQIGTEERQRKGQPQCPDTCAQKHMPDSTSSENALLVACALAVKTAQLKTGGPSRQGISRARCRRQRVWLGKRLLEVFAGPRAWVDPDDVPGDYDFSLHTIRKIALQVIFFHVRQER